MSELFVLVEHRKDAIRDITFEMLCKADQLSRELSSTVTAVLMGWQVEGFIGELRERADRILVVEDELLKHFNAEMCQKVLYDLIGEYHPLLTLIGHTSWGLDLAPALAVKTGFPLVTDCLDIVSEKGDLKAVRELYSGKVYARMAFKKSAGYLATVRPGAFPSDKAGSRQAEVIKRLCGDLPKPRKHFVEFVDTFAGETDIAQADLLISVGLGIGEKENIALVEELAGALGGVLACSRPIVDNKWLPKYRQVGTSGKSVKPKVYLALGISGAFQHVAGITGAGTVIAVNKDHKAPIFRVAHYGVVDDLFKVAPALLERIKELRH
jgi:electron transfer flavoprotein alpha subunit